MVRYNNFHERQGTGPASEEAFPVAMKTPAPTVTPKPRPTTSLVLRKKKNTPWTMNGWNLLGCRVGSW